MSKISELDAVIRELRDTAASIKGMADSLEEMLSSNTPAEKPQPTITLPEIRAILAEKSRAGYTAQVKELLRQHGADKLSAIDPAEYAALVKEAEGIGNG